MPKPTQPPTADPEIPLRRTTMRDDETGFALEEDGFRFYLRDIRHEEDIGIFELWQRLDAVESYERARAEVKRDRALNPKVGA
jgi:hypothetical protein